MDDMNELVEVPEWLRSADGRNIRVQAQVEDQHTRRFRAVDSMGRLDVEMIDDGHGYLSIHIEWRAERQGGPDDAVRSASCEVLDLPLSQAEVDQIRDVSGDLYLVGTPPPNP